MARWSLTGQSRTWCTIYTVIAHNVSYVKQGVYKFYTSRTRNIIVAFSGFSDNLQKMLETFALPSEKDEFFVAPPYPLWMHVRLSKSEVCVSSCGCDIRCFASLWRPASRHGQLRQRQTVRDAAVSFWSLLQHMTALLWIPACAQLPYLLFRPTRRLPIPLVRTSVLRVSDLYGIQTPWKCDTTKERRLYVNEHTRLRSPLDN